MLNCKSRARSRNDENICFCFSPARPRRWGGAGNEAALLTRAICRACGERREIPAQCRLPLTPGEERDQQVGGLCPGDHSPRRTTLAVPRELCNSELFQGVLNKEIFPCRLFWGRGRDRGRQRMNSQVGKEGGKGEGRGSWFADSKICGSCWLKSPRTKKPLPSSRPVLPPTSSLSCYGCFVQ